MRRCGTLIALLLTSIGAQAQSSSSIESPRLAALSRQLTAGDARALDAFWQEIAHLHTPLVDTMPGESGQILVTFLWRAAAGQQDVNVSVSEVGEEDATDPAARRLTRLRDSDVWFRTYRISDRARFAYSLLWPQGRIPDPQAVRRDVQQGVTYELFDDPLNRKAFFLQFNEKSDAATWDEKTTRRSYAEGPRAPAEPYLAERPGVARGTITTAELDSAILGNRRRISVYAPRVGRAATQGATSC